MRGLAKINLLIRRGHAPAAVAAHRRAADKAPYRRVPYMFIAPRTRGAVGAIATTVFSRRYGGHRVLRAPDLVILSRLLGGESEQHGELISYLLFDPDFIKEAIALGRSDADRWLERVSRPDAPWHAAPIEGLPHT